MATKQALGKATIILKGEYSNTTEYYRLNLITYLGSVFIAKKTTLGNIPTENNNEYWQLLIKKPVDGKNGEDGKDYVITESDYNAIAEVTKGKIDLTQFVTVTTTNLLNYYLKSETYTKSEVNDLIGQIQGVSFVKVDTLPATGDTNKIYLVPKTSSKTANVYDEYIYFNNSWELIGDTDIDLSDYYKKTQVDNLLTNKANTSDIPTKTSDLTNDSGFIDNSYHDDTKQDVIDDLETIRSGASAGATALQSYTETDPTVPNHVKGISENDISNWNSKSTFSGSYNDLTDKPTIPTVPTNVSAFTNDAGYLTEHQSLEGYATESWVEGKGYLTSHQDISGKQDKSTLETDVKNFIDKTYIESLIEEGDDVGY